MAMLLKDRYDLKTLRCWIGFRETTRTNDDKGFPSERILRTQLYEGKESVGDAVDTPFNLLGLNADGSPPTKDWAPDLAETRIADQLRTAAEGNPAAVWLHIKQDSYPLALLPWEEMTGRIINVPVLRIGNFVDDPYKPVKAPVIAICASQPVGDGPFQVDAFVGALLAAIQNVVVWSDVKPRITLFADGQWLQQIRQVVGHPDFAHLQVEIVEPETTPAVPLAERAGSVWLKWIADHFAGFTVDIVHFVTPGWFAENHGAIALAETPTYNSGKGEFVGAAELASFYDRLGCSGMAFSSPNMPEWEWGQRMLAFELSWLRPGPVLVFEHSAQDYESLASAYGLLFGGGWHAIDPLGYVASPPQLTCHPQLLAGLQDDEDENLIAPKPITEPGDLLSRQVEQAIAQLQPTRDLSMTEQWEATGAASALAFVKSLV
jgi:hypothetical protein